jgi:hypothetical protein
MRQHIHYRLDGIEPTSKRAVAALNSMGAALQS